VLALLLGTAAASADDVATTTLPLPKQSYLRLEPTYTFDGGGSAAELAVRGVLVYPGWFLPQPDATRVISAVGVDLAFPPGDVSLTQLSGVVFDGGIVGTGITIALPTHGGRFGIGPAWFGQITTPALDLALLARTFFATDALATRFEPAVVVHLPRQFALSSDGEIDVDWLARSYTLPLNLEVVRPLGEHVVIQLGPQVVIAGRDRGAVTLDLKIDVVAP
jgi:hypothetical protein